MDQQGFEMRVETKIDVKVLPELFEVDFENGELLWRERPISHFESERAKNVFNQKYAGKKAGSLNTRSGYSAIAITLNGLKVSILKHRIIWAMNYGSWPGEHMEIDHINRDRNDNSLSNLRLATSDKNRGNLSIYKSNSSGFKGVSKCIKTNKWMAQKQSFGKNKLLSLWESPELAAAARIGADMWEEHLNDLGVIDNRFGSTEV